MEFFLSDRSVVPGLWRSCDTSVRICDLLLCCLPTECSRVCVCVFCNPSVSPKEWVCFVKLWPVFSPLSSTHLSLCCSCHFISQLPTGRLTKEYGKAVVSIYSLSFLLSLLYRFFIVCVCEFVCFCSHVCAKLFCVSVRRKPEDLSREVIQIQQREFALKEQNYTLNSR